MKRTALAMLLLLAISACKDPTPGLPVPPAPAATGYGDVPAGTASANTPGGGAQRFLKEMDVPGAWWSLFRCAQVNALVDEALAKNPDVEEAQATLRAAIEAFYAQRSSAYPTVQGSFSTSRQQVPTYYAPPLNQPGRYVYGISTASLDVAYTPDVFGNLRYQTRSAAAAAEITRFQAEATYLTLTSNVVAAAVQVASLRDQIAATGKVIDLDRHLLELTQSQKTYAQASELDVLAQENALRQAEQSLPPLEKALAQTYDLLARLVGRAPGDRPAAPPDLASFHLPQDLPLSLPSKLIQQRPDVAAAEASLRQASAQVGIAYTNRLPNFAITAQTATQALSLLALFGPGTLLSTLTASVAATFYDHGTLKHREAAAVAAYDESAAAYKGAVLSGFQNVADSVIALQSDANELVAAHRAEVTSQKALRIVDAQKSLGEVSASNELTAEQNYQQSVLTQTQAETARYADTIALFTALGGGWWNRANVVPEGK